MENSNELSSTIETNNSLTESSITVGLETEILRDNIDETPLDVSIAELETESNNPSLNESVLELENTNEHAELSLKEQKLEVDEEVSVYMNQLNLAQITVMNRVRECASPLVRFVDDKFTILDGDKIFMQADWHFIGEFRTEKENPEIKGYEFVWSWALRPDAEEDPHVKEVHLATEALPYGLQPLTFPLVQFEDVGIIELIKAYAFLALNLDFLHIVFNSTLNSYGIFGLHNMRFSNEKKSNVLDTIVNQAKNRASELQKNDPQLSGSDAIKQAWQTPEILALVSAYQKDKRHREKAAEEFKNFFKRALADPSLVIDTAVTDSNDDNYANALQAVEKSLEKVREEELGQMEQLGDEVD